MSKQTLVIIADDVAYETLRDSEGIEAFQTYIQDDFRWGVYTDVNYRIGDITYGDDNTLYNSDDEGYQHLHQLLLDLQSQGIQHVIFIWED